MNKDNPLTLTEADDYWRQLKALLGPRVAELRINDMAREMFSLQTRHQFAADARRKNISMVTIYIIELHRCGSLPVARAMLTHDDARGVLT